MEERLTKLENKLLMVARSTDGNTEVMLGGLQTIDTRLAMLFLILEDVVASLPAHLLMMKVGDRRKIDLDHYEKKALEALAAQDPKPVAKEPASDGEEVAVFFGGKE